MCVPARRRPSRYFSPRALASCPCHGPADIPVGASDTFLLESATIFHDEVDQLIMSDSSLCSLVELMALMSDTIPHNTVSMWKRLSFNPPNRHQSFGKFDLLKNR
jgi:hypothetical protein